MTVVKPNKDSNEFDGGKEEGHTSEEWGEISLQQKEEESKVEIEIEDDEESVEEEATSETVEEETTEEESKKEDTEKKEIKELEGIETNGAQKRIRQLVKQRKEREEENKLLRQRIAEYEAKMREQATVLVETQKNNIESSKKALEDQVKQASAMLEKALESGEAKEVVEAQRNLYKAELKLDQVSNIQIKEPLKAPSQQEQVQPQQEINPADYDNKAIQWAVANEDWFNKDQLLTAAALAIDAQLKDEGYDPSDDEFYSEVDIRLAKAFPTKFKQSQEQVEKEVTEPKAPTKPSQVVGSASRTVANPSTGRSRKVKLTQSDIEQANRWGISLERYAEQKLQAEQAGDGYATISIKRGGN